MQGGVVCDEMTVCLLECNPKWGTTADMPSTVLYFNQPQPRTDQLFFTRSWAAITESA